MHKDYTPYEGPTLANQNSRKLVVFDRKLDGSHSLYAKYFAKYQRVMMHSCFDIIVFILFQ